MTDLISRADAIEAVCTLGTSLERNGKFVITMIDAKYAFMEILESLPSADAVQVVRCNECKWFKPNQLAPVHPLLGGGIVYENQCERCLGIVPNEDGYCSRGERKEP